MRLTPDACAAVYECLRQLSPFKGWKLPSSDEVEFAVTKDKKHFGTHTHYIGTDEHIIEISEENNGHFNTLATTMAHEMIHMHQRRTKRVTKAQHNPDFKRRAKLVCKELGWDAKAF